MSKICPPDKILNPETGRCVKIDSAKGKQIWNNLPIHLDELEVVRVIGRGGFGETTLIRDTVTGKKYIRKESVRDNEQEMRYQYSMLHALEQKNLCRKHFICPVTKYRDMDHRYFIVFDYLEGYQDLLDGTRNWYGEAMKIETAKKILRSVKLLHKNGIVHVDIKPNNIMVNPLTGDVRIIDFGTALLQKTPTTLYMLKGYTSDFVSPNVNKHGFNSFDRLVQNDLWATGMTLYKLLKGRYPNLDDESSKYTANQFLKDKLNTRTNFFL